MRYFGVPTCPYCKKRVNLIRTWSLKRQGEYQCPRCGGISNIFLSPLIYVMALLAVFAGGALYFFHKFVLDDIELKTAIYVVIPFAVFFLFSLFMVYLEKPVIKKISKEEYKRNRRQRQTLDENQPQATPVSQINDSQEFIPVIRTNRALLENTGERRRASAQQPKPKAQGGETGVLPQAQNTQHSPVQQNALQHNPAQRGMGESRQIDLDSFSRAKRQAAQTNLQHSQQIRRGVRQDALEGSTTHIDRPTIAAQTQVQSKAGQPVSRRPAQPQNQARPSGASPQMVQALRDSGAYPPARQTPQDARQVPADPATQAAARAETDSRRRTPIQQTAYSQQGGNFRQQAQAIQQHTAAQQRASSYQSGNMQRPATPKNIPQAYQTSANRPAVSSAPARPTAYVQQPADSAPPRQVPAGYQQYRSQQQDTASSQRQPAPHQQFRSSYQQQRSQNQGENSRRSSRVIGGIETPLNHDDVMRR